MALLTRKELAEKLGVSAITIHRWKMEKGLPFKQLSAKTIRFDLKEVYDWMEETDNYPKIEKLFLKVVDTFDNKEVVHEFDTWEELAKSTLALMKTKKATEEIYIAEKYAEE